MRAFEKGLFRKKTKNEFGRTVPERITAEQRQIGVRARNAGFSTGNRSLPGNNRKSAAENLPAFCPVQRVA